MRRKGDQAAAWLVRRLFRCRSLRDFREWGLLALRENRSLMQEESLRQLGFYDDEPPKSLPKT